MDLSKELVVVSMPTKQESYTSFQNSEKVISTISNYKKIATKINGTNVIGPNEPEIMPISSTLANGLRVYSGEYDETGRLINGSSLFDFSDHMQDIGGRMLYNPEGKTPFNVLVFSDPFKKKEYNTLGLIERGNQYTVFEVTVNNNEVQKLKKPIVVFNKFDSEDIIYRNLNGVNKITQRVNSYDEHGVKTIMNHDYYSIIKNLFIASKKNSENEISGFINSVDALKTYAKMNVRNLSSRTTENMVTVSQVLDMTGIGNKASYNDLTSELQFSKKMIDPYLDQVTLSFDFKYRANDKNNKLMKKDILNSINDFFDERRLSDPYNITLLTEDNNIREQIAEEILYDFLNPVIDDEGNRMAIKLEDGKKVSINKSLKEFVTSYIDKASKEYYEYENDKRIFPIKKDNVKYSISTQDGSISNLRIRLNDKKYIDLNLSKEFREAQINSQMVKEKALYQINKTRYYFQTDDMFQTDDGVEMLKNLTRAKIGSRYGETLDSSDGILSSINKMSAHYNGVQTDLTNFISEFEQNNLKMKSLNDKGLKYKEKYKRAKTKNEQTELKNKANKIKKDIKELEEKNALIKKESIKLYQEEFGDINDEVSLYDILDKFSSKKSQIFEEAANIVQNEYNLKVLQAEGFQSLEEYEKYKEKVLTDYNNFVNDPNVSEIDKKLETTMQDIRKSKIKFIDSAIEKFDKEHFMEFVYSGNKINKYVDVSLQSNNTKGIINQMLLSTMDLLGSRNVFGQRHGQAASKMSSAVLKTASGQTLDVAEISATWSPIDKYNQFKVLNKNAETVLEGYKQLTGDTNLPSLFKNISTSIYTETDFSFQDSELTSTLMGMRNLSMYDDKSITISYDSLNRTTLFDGMEIDEVSDYFRKVGKFNVDNLKNADSFEYKFLQTLLNKDAFASLVNNINGDMVEDFKEIGSGLNSITSLNTVAEQELYIKETQNALNKYNMFLNKYFVKSNDRGKGVSLINPDAVGKGQTLSISGANFGYIEGIEFNEEGIKILTKGLTVQSLGSKIMNDGIKGTVGNQAHLFGINYDGHFYRGDVIVNEKMTKGKRGFGGTFYGRSLLTMSLHSLSGEGKLENKNLPVDYGKRFNNFLNIMKENTVMDLGSGKKMNIFELLGVDIQFDSSTNSLSIGETALTGEGKKKFLSLMGGFGDLQSAQQYLIEITNKRFNDLINHAVNDSEAEMISNMMINTLYGAYDKYLETLDDSSKKAARIFIPSKGATLVKSFVTQNKTDLKYGMETVQNIGKQGAFVLLSFTHGMSEAKAREIDEAVKLTRLSNIVLTESGYSWLSEELNNAMVYKNTDDVMDELLINNNRANLKPGSTIYNNYFDNVVDFKGDKYETVNTNTSLRNFIQKSTLGRFIDYDSEAGKLNKPLKGRLVNFDNKLIEDAKETIEGIKGKKIINTMFSYSFDLMTEDDMLLKEMFKNLSEDEINSIVSSNMSYTEAKKAKINYLKKKVSSIFDDVSFMNDFDFALRTDPDYQFDTVLSRMQGKMAKILLGDKADEFVRTFQVEKPDYYKKMKNVFSFVKTVSAGLSLDIGNLNHNSFSYEFLGKEKYRIQNALKENGLGLLNDLINDFSKGDAFNLNLLRSVAENNSLPFLVKTISMDKIGDIVPNKSLDRVNKIINMQKQLSELSSIEKLQLGDLIPEDLKDIAKDELDSILKRKSDMLIQYREKNYWKRLYPHLDIKAKKDIVKMVSSNKKISKAQKEAFELLDKSEAAELKSILEGNSANKIKNKALSLLFGIDSNQVAGFQTSSVITQLERVLNGSENGTYKISQISDIIRNIQTTQDSIQGMTNMQENYKILENLKNKVSQFEESIIQKRISNSVNENNITSIHNYLVTNIFGKLQTNREKITQRMFKAMFGFKQEGTPFDDFASMRIDKSAAVSPREGSAITNFIRNEAQEIIDLSKGNKHKKEVIEKTKEFRKAIGLLYGDFHWKDVEKMLKDGDASSIKTKFDRLSGVVVARKEQWEKVNFLNFFKWKSNYNHYTYIDLLRNPHQYIGSIKPVRAIMIDETNQNLSFLKYMFGNQNEVNGGQNNLLFLGKRTAISANGDFDGDVFQIMRYTETDFKHLDRTARRNLIKRLHTSRELYYILNDHANEDLEAIFKDPDFLKKHGKDQFGEMYKLIKKLSEHEGFSIDDFDPSKAYKIIKDRHHILKFEYLRTLDAMEDESKQHGDLPTIGKKISAEVEKITGGKLKGDFAIDRAEFEKIILSLDENEKRKLFFSTVGEDKVEVIDKFFDKNTISNEVRKKLNEFKRLDKQTRELVFYDYFNNLLNDNKGILKINGLFLADTSYEAYTGISRTGIIHSSLTAVREAATFVRQKKEFNNWIKYAINEAQKNGVEIDDLDKFALRLKRMTSFANTFGSFNTLGTMIEKLSISSKLGGKVDPYISANNINKFGKVLAGSNKLERYINFKNIENFVMGLRTNMTADIFEYDDGVSVKNINTIKDITDVFLHRLTDDKKPAYMEEKAYKAMQRKAKEIELAMQNVFGAMLGIDVKDPNFMNVELDDKSARNLLANSANVASIIVKGFLESEIKSKNVVNGMYNIISKGTNMAASLDYFLNEDAPRGVNQRSVIGLKFIENIKKWIVKKTSNAPTEEIDTRSKYKGKYINSIKEKGYANHKSTFDRRAPHPSSIVLDNSEDFERKSIIQSITDTLEQIKGLKGDVEKENKQITEVIDNLINEAKSEVENFVNHQKVDEQISDAAETLDGVQNQKAKIQDETVNNTGKKIRQQSLFSQEDLTTSSSNKSVDENIAKKAVSKSKKNVNPSLFDQFNPTVKTTKPEPTVKELRETAKQMGLKGYSKLRKAQLIELIENNQNLNMAQNAEEEIINKFDQIIKPTDPNNQYATVEEPLLKRVDPENQPAKVYKRRGRPPKKQIVDVEEAVAANIQEQTKNTSDAEINELNNQTINENNIREEVQEKIETNKRTFENISQETQNTSDDIIEELRSNNKNLQSEIDDLQNEITQLKKDLEKKAKQLNKRADKKYTTNEKNEIVQKELNKLKEKLNSKLEERLKKIEELEQKVLDSAEQLNQSNQTINKLNKDLKEAQGEIANLGAKIKNAEIDSETNVKKQASDVIDNTSKEVKNFLSKHKSSAMIAGGVAALALFFRIFQSNRSVVELNINEEQYEKSQGSLYRSLGNYNINTNIRSFY